MTDKLFNTCCIWPYFCNCKSDRTTSCCHSFSAKLKLFRKFIQILYLLFWIIQGVVYSICATSIYAIQIYHSGAERERGGELVQAVRGEGEGPLQRVQPEPREKLKSARPKRTQRGQRHIARWRCLENRIRLKSLDFCRVFFISEIWDEIIVLSTIVPLNTLC